MDALLEYWPLIFAALAAVAVGGYLARDFVSRPTGEQIEAVKEWLLYATTQAEKELGSGTGQLKLRQVYDLFLQRFPLVSRAIPFDLFSGWVDEALERMKRLLATNAAVQSYIGSRNAEGGDAK